VSGPLSKDDVEAGTAEARPPVVEVTPSRVTDVGGAPVRRALPRRTRRTVGAWCFVDHVGPLAIREPDEGLDIGPHPHIGLHTVTWLLAGELVHTDSLGTEQPIRPGQLNLMTAGRGVAHAEDGRGTRGDLHAVQLWVAQPEATRHGDPAFEHHAQLPRLDLPGIEATVLIGEVDGTASDARHDTELLGAELVLHGRPATLPLRDDFEHALVVLDGEVEVEGADEPVRPGSLAYLGLGREELALGGTGRALLLGGVPFEAQLVMWWNYVARDRAEIGEAHAAWQGLDEERFGPVRSRLERIGGPSWPV
jgi:quercetin 2,3-dioxygenase